MILLKTMMLMRILIMVHVLGMVVALLLHILLVQIEVVLVMAVCQLLISVMDQVSMEMLHGVQTVLMVQMKELNVANLAIMMQMFV